MSGATRTIQQPASAGSLFAALAVSAAIVTAALAISLGSANLGKANPVAAPAPAIYAPAVRDLGSRDLSTLPAVDTSAPIVGPRGPIGYHGSDSTTGTTSQPLGYHGFGPSAHAGFGPTGNQLKDDLNHGSNSGASGAGRNLAPRAQ